MAVTVSYSETRRVQKVTLTWVSDGAGAASGSTKKVSGNVYRVVFIPSSLTAPTENYTAILTDTDGVDVLMGYGGLGLSATITRSVVPMEMDTAGQPAFPFVVDGVLTLTIAGAGNTKAGTVILYIG